MASGLMRSTAVVSAMTLLSRILGFVRDVMLARLFGADAAMDAFLVAFKIPNFLRRLFAEGSFSQAFVPVLAEQKIKQTPEEVCEVVSRTSGTLAGVLLIVTILGVVGSPVLMFLFAPGFAAEPEKFALGNSLLRITFPYLLFVSLTALAGGVLQTYGRFASPAFAPTWLNVCFIVGAWWAVRHMAQPIYGLAWAVFVAGILQLLFLLPSLHRIGMLAWPRWGWRHPAVRRVLILMIPTLFGSSVAQINLLFDTLIASFLASGSVSWLYYSDRLMEFPLGMFGIALGTVILPSLSARHAAEDKVGFNATIDWALRLVLLITVPAGLGLALLGEPILATLFYSPTFSVHDVQMSAASLAPYSAGLFGFIAVKVVVPAYYARQDTRTPVRIGIIAMVSNMLINVVLAVVLVQMHYPAPHAGLALATSLAAFINAGLLYRGLRQSRIYQPLPGWRRLFMRVMLASLAMSAVLTLAIAHPEQWYQHRGITRAAWLAFWVTLGALTYGAMLFLLGLRVRHLKGPEHPVTSPGATL